MSFLSRRLLAVATVVGCVFGSMLTSPRAWAQAADPGAVPSMAAPTAAPASAPDSGKLRRPRTESRPLWEFGLGFGGLSLPDYRGAADRSAYLLPVPYIAYRGKWLRADRDGTRAVFLESRNLEVNLSVSGSPPVRHTSRGARLGMEELPGTFEIGPNLNYTLWRSPTPGTKIDLRLPVRAAITLESHPHSIGAVALPHINLDQANLIGGWNLGMQAGPIFATSGYHQHYYGVGAKDATASRPIYKARGGYSGWQLVAATSKRFGSAWAGAFIRYDRLAGATFDDSPLVRRRNSVTAGFGISWIFLRSDDSVDVPLDD